MTSVWRRILSAAIVSVALVVAVGCGRNDEVVYLDVFNGYPGASSLSVFGPTGAVTNDLPFGKRTPSFAEIDRNIGTDFTIQIEGAPSPVETSLPLFEMYPHESATLFVKRRSGTSEIDANLFRHVRTGYKGEDRQCVMVFDNALSTADPKVSTYNYVPVFKVNPECVGYLSRLGSYLPSPRAYEESDELSLPDDAPKYLFRPGLFAKVKQFPWFAAVDLPEGEIRDIRFADDDNPETNAGCKAYGADVKPDVADTNRGRNFGDGDAVRFVWAPVRSIMTRGTFEEIGSPTSIEMGSGSVTAPPPTRKYLNCIGWDPEKSVEDNIDKLKETQRQKITKCKRGNFSAQPVNLNQQITQYEFTTGFAQDLPADQCGFKIRVASDLFTIFERVEGEAGGVPIATEFTFPPSQFSFWTLYGRPIDPKVEAWGVADKESGGGFVRLPKYPQ